MRKLAVLLLLPVFFSCASKHPVINVVDYYAVPLDSVIKEVQTQYKDAVEELDKDGIAINVTSADLALKVTHKFTGSADVQVLIFKPTGKYIRTNSSTVTFHLTQGGEKSLLGKDDKGSLKALIVGSARQFVNSKESIGTLALNSYDLDIAFIIEKDVSLPLSFKILTVGVDIGAEYDSSVEHDLTMKFTAMRKQK